MANPSKKSLGVCARNLHLSGSSSLTNFTKDLDLDAEVALAKQDKDRLVGFAEKMAIEADVRCLVTVGMMQKSFRPRVPMRTLSKRAARKSSMVPRVAGKTFPHKRRCKATVSLGANKSAQVGNFVVVFYPHAS